jgi:aquaporin Z
MNKANIFGEFLGTFAFIFAILTSGGNAYVVGGALILIILLLQHMSGGHVNPAVSLAMYFSSSVNFGTMISYIAVQLSAAFLAVKAYNFFYGQ